MSGFNLLLLFKLDSSVGVNKAGRGGDGGVLTFGGAPDDSSIHRTESGRGGDRGELTFEGDGDVDFESRSRLEDNSGRFLNSLGCLGLGCLKVSLGVLCSFKCFPMFLYNLSTYFMV